MLNANDKIVYPLYPISTKSANNIRFSKKNSDEGLWEFLKTELFNTGYEAISEFVGYEYDPGMDKSAVENVMDEIYQQMPDEDYDVFLTKYGLI